MRPRLAALTVASLLVAAAPAHARDPIMPLSDVRSDRDCEARTVVRGTEIATFDVRVIDVVDFGAHGFRILVEASGPAVDSTGIAEGFSGSPVYCRDDDGRLRNVGAISEGVGDFGNRKGLVTPIEEVLGEPLNPRRRVRAAGPALRSAARPLATPITVAGLSPTIARLITRTARRAGGVVIAAPSAPFRDVPPQELRPGASMAVGFSSGDIALSGVGTVTYADRGRIWGFGHAFEGVGRRSLLLQDAYVSDVISNPVGAEGLISYKLAAPVHDLGTVMNDASAAVVGRIGRLPDRIPVRVDATDLDSGRGETTSAQVADEADVGFPSGESPLALVAPLAVFEAGHSVLRGTPARQSGRLCVRIGLRERTRPLRFCNRYVSDGAGSFPGENVVQLLPAFDLAEAVSRVDSYTPAALHVTGVRANLRLTRALRQAYLLGASVRGPAQPGKVVLVKLRVRVVRGRVRTLRFLLRVPRGLEPGKRAIRLVGAPADSLEDELFGEAIFGDLFGEDEDEGGDPGPQSLEELAKEVAAVGRYDGVRARFPSARGRRSERAKPVFRDPDLRISGSTTLKLTVPGRQRDRKARPRRPA